MKVSVVIPCHNSAQYLPKTLESLERQTIGIDNLEIIIVDDLSDDKGATEGIIRSFEQKYPDNVKAIILNEHHHVGGARNIAMGYMTGDYLLNLDSDDLYHENAIKRLVDIAIKYRADAVEFCTQDITGYNDELLPYLDENRPFGLIEINSEEERKKYIVSHAISQGCCRRLYRADIIRKHSIKYPEGHTLEEPAFTMIYRMYTNRHFFLNERIHYYLHHDGGIISSGVGAEDRKYDNAYTHEMLYCEFIKRGFFDNYWEEIEYIFFRGYFFETLLYAARCGYFFDVDEFAILQTKIKETTPNIKENKYYNRDFIDLPAMDDIIGESIDKVDINLVRFLFEKMWENM